MGRVDALPTPADLTPRQREVLELVAKGLTNQEICSLLEISAATVKTHVATILRVLDVSNRTEAAAAYSAFSWGERAPGEPPGPALAVLPFTAFSADPDQQVIAEGMTEDLIALLSRMPGLGVIARGTVHRYSGVSVDVRQVGRELGVRYGVAGSVRRAAGRLRVSAQLLWAESGRQLWGDRWDRPLDEMFEVQDEIAAAIAGRLEPELILAEAERAAREPAPRLGAWESYQRAIVAFYFRGLSARHSDEALGHLDRALEVDSGYAHARALRSTVLSNRVVLGWSRDPRSEARDALAAGRAALELAPNDPLVLQHWGSTLSTLDDPARAVPVLERSVELDPSNAQAWAGLGLYLARTHHPDEGEQRIERALRLSPHDPRLYLWRAYLSIASLARGDWEGLVGRARESIEHFDGFPMAWGVLACVLALLGRDGEALEAGGRARALQPSIRFAALRSFLERHGPTDRAVPWAEALERAGLRDP